MDELDRCRPDYALQMLETIKHFFAVPNVHFVLGTNIDALHAIVRHRYGNWDGSLQYTQKFISLVVSLPNQRDHEGNNIWSKYFDNLVKAMGIPSTDIAKDILSLYGRNHIIQLRDVERFLTRASLLPANFSGWLIGYQRLVFSAIVLHVFAPSSYAELRSNKLNFEKLVEIFPTPTGTGKPYRVATALHHDWRRALLDHPDTEALEATSETLGLRLGQDRKAHFDKVWSEAFDQFEVPTGR